MARACVEYLADEAEYESVKGPFGTYWLARVGLIGW
jgi:hypothetical protein